MAGKKIIFYILAAFIAGNLLLIFIQYNSVKNINKLIDGNEKVISEIDVSNNLRALNRENTAIDAKIAAMPYTLNSLHQENIDSKIIDIQAYIDTLQKISDDDSSVKYIDVLDALEHNKLALSKIALASPVSLIDKTPNGLSEKTKALNDSIKQVTHIIEQSRQKLLGKITNSIDASGKKALNLGNMLIVFVLVSGAVLFWMIIVTIKRQSLLINQLNISEKRAKAAAQIKENFMANMSHEIRTPMNAVLGFTSLLKEKPLDDEAKEYVQTIQKSGENLLTIINDILDLSKIEAGMMRIETAAFNIRALLHSVETMFKLKSDEKKLILSSSVDDSLPEIVEGDATRLTQILINLIGNAIKFTNHGSIFINVTNNGIDNDKIKTGITITDTGIGIEKDKIENVFERFNQAEDTVTRKYGGTGLGLSIVKELVKLQHGTIDVKSQRGVGTTFNLEIPYKTIYLQKLNTQKSVETKIAQKTNLTEMDILVAEDNEINQTLIKHIFKKWQIQFDIANNGVKAIELLQQKKYHLILMDIQMPGMDGYTATIEIRKTLNLQTPIIAMTAHAMAGEMEKCISLGMNDYIAKPLREEQLYNIINRFTKITKSSSVSV